VKEGEILMSAKLINNAVEPAIVLLTDENEGAVSVRRLRYHIGMFKFFKATQRKEKHSD